MLRCHNKCMFLQGCPTSLKVMYEVVQTHKSLPDIGAAASLHMDTGNSTLHLLSSDNTIQLNKGGEDIQLSCETEISSVSVAVDLVPDDKNLWLGNIAAARWMDGDAHDMTTMKNAIEQTGACTQNLQRENKNSSVPSLSQQLLLYCRTRIRKEQSHRLDTVRCS